MKYGEKKTYIVGDFVYLKGFTKHPLVKNPIVYIVEKVNVIRGKEHSYSISTLTAYVSEVFLNELKPATKEEYVSLLNEHLESNLEYVKNIDKLEDTPDNFLPFHYNKKEAIDSALEYIEKIKDKIKSI